MARLPIDDNHPQEPLREHNRGESLSAEKLSKLTRAVNARRGVAPPSQVPRAKKGSTGLVGAVVKINKAIAILADAVGQVEQDNFEAWGPHISCVKVLPDQSVGDTLIPCDPIYPHDVQEYKDIGYNSADPDDPWMTLVAGYRGLPVIPFGTAQIWVAPPEPGELCA